MKDQFSKNTENKSPFRIAWELSPDGFVTFHPFFDENGNLIDFIFTFQNQAAAKMIGTDPVKVVGQRLLELFPGQRNTRFFRTYKEVYETGKPQEFEDHYKDENFKEDLWFRIVTIPAGDGIAVHAQNITERKKVEEALRKSKEQYDLLFNSIQEGFAHYEAIYDRSGRVNDLRVIEINPAGALISGVSREDQIGRTWKEVWTGIEDELFDMYDKVDKSGEPVRFENLSGITNRWYLNNVSRLAPGHLAVTFFDITERKQAEIALRESEERFRMTFEKAAIGIAYILPDGKWLKVNDTYCKMLGYTRKELYDFTFKDITHHDDLENDLQMREKLLGGLIDSFSIEKRYIKKDGSIKWAILTCSLAHEESTGLKYMISVLEDITELKQEASKRVKANEALQKSEAQLLEAQKLARIGSYSIDFKNNGKMEWSDEMYNIWEVKKDEPFPTVEEVWELVHPDDLEELNRVLTHQLPESERVETEFRIVFPGNRIKYVHIITRVSFDENGNLSKREGIEMDITERKIAQIELEKTLNELERSNQELQQFAYVASHDLQEPLRMVSSYMSILEKKYYDQLDDRGREFIHFAIDGSKRMTNLIKDLLTYSRVTSQAKEFRETDLNEIYNDVTRDLQVLIKEKGAKITASKLPVIKADPIQIHQLFQNLIGNAIKFHGEKTPEVSIKVKAVKNGWLFSVKDNGIGIDSQYYERIFQVFQRLHERDIYPGTGIGLAVCKKIVERHGGRIWVESEIDKGTTFYFTIT